MSDALVVLLGDQVAGTLTRLTGGQLRFDYDRDYRESEAPTPLSLSMPARIASHPDRVVTPWLWGLLPDNEAVLRRWARELQASASSPFSLLSTPVGEDCAGAVRFVAPDRVEEALGRSGEVTWLDEDGVAERLRELREDSTAWLGEAFTGQFSLAGAQAKTALLLEGDRWGVPSGSIPTTHILKPGVQGLADQDLDEHLCLDAARRAGLVVSRTRIERFAGIGAIVVERYDRLRVGERIVRVHQEDLCQALGLHLDRKYQRDGGPTPDRIARLLRNAMPPSVAEVDAFVKDASPDAYDCLVEQLLVHDHLHPGDRLVKAVTDPGAGGEARGQVLHALDDADRLVVLGPGGVADVIGHPVEHRCEHRLEDGARDVRTDGGSALSR